MSDLEVIYPHTCNPRNPIDYDDKTLIKCSCGRWLYRTTKPSNYTGIIYSRFAVWKKVRWFNLRYKKRIREYNTKKTVEQLKKLRDDSTA